MHTIFRSPQGWAVRIYPNNHRPPHVHVVARDAEARFELHCALRRVRLIDNHGFRRGDLNAMAAQLVERIHELCEKWGEIHG